ncbi:GDSL-type esterase/lipase family protein [Paraflavitalea sp. CAU 1676]|uniref:GDSL-type esterase/lipase family protein n=1 Tax=Paraflavitalea sp. CAU 1676 TaxID=3032598 RepID=UPI0023DBC5F6|nr:GDSL-type esterase/lipase family protein [Paraflavitalea sp. CAU 1676]MDF2189638.1 GDSL-type esterase/lipase family protein [Paraflavitalea sp. CAU 1676]
MRTYLLAALLAMGAGARAQSTESTDSSYANGYYVERVKYFDSLHPVKKGIVFLGNSITEVGEWSEVLPGKPVVNRGISGDNSWGVYARLDQVLAMQPRKIFLLIGVNDIKRGTGIDAIVNNYDRIAAKIKAASPRTKLYFQSVLPVTESVLANIYVNITNAKIKTLNERMEVIAAKYNCPFIDLHPVFDDGKGQLKRELTTDGLHLKPAAYILWANYLMQGKYL